MFTDATECDSAGDLRALLLPLLPDAYRLALCMSGNRVDAHDLVEVAAFAARRRFDTRRGADFRVWFYRIMYEAFVGGPAPADRGARSDPTAEARPPARTVPVDAGDRIALPDVRRIVAAIGTIPEEQRIVTSLYFVDRLSYVEIGSVVRLTVAEVRSRLHRGRAMLEAGLS